MKNTKTTGDWIAEYMKHLEVLNRSENTLSTKEFHFGKFLDWAGMRGLDNVQHLTRANMEQFQRYLAGFRKTCGEKLVVDTQIGILSTLRSWLDWLEGRGHVVSNPMKSMEFPRSPRNRQLPNRGLSDDELKRLLAVPDVKTCLGLRDKALLHLVLSSGLRLDECASLVLVDLDRKERSVFVRDGKGGVQRMTYYSEEASKWLELYLADSRPKMANARSKDGLFLSNRGTHMNDKVLGQQVRGLFDSAGIDGYGACHRLRHTFTRILVKSSVNIVSIKDLLGHKSLATTSRYANVHADDTRKEYLKAVGF